MTDELTPSLAGRPTDSEADKTERQVRAVDALSEALRPLIDGKVVLACDVTVVVQHPDGKVGSSHFNISATDQAKRWAAARSAGYHLGLLGTPDRSESHSYRVPKKN